MDLAKYYIGPRYLFGFLVPGALWLVALLLLSRRPGTGIAWLLRRFKNAKLQDWVVFLTLSFLVGHAMTPLTGWIPSGLGKWLNRTVGLTPSAEEQLVYPGFEGDMEALERRAREVAARRLGDRGFVNSLTPGDFQALCKRTILGKEKTMADRLMEYENEINLRGGPVAPLLALTIALVWCWTPLRGSCYPAVNPAAPVNKGFVPRMAGWVYSALHYIRWFFRWCRIRKAFALLCLLLLALLLARSKFPAGLDETRAVYEMYYLLDKEFGEPAKK